MMQARPYGETRLRSGARRLSRPGLIESATIILILVLYSGAIFVVVITGTTTENSVLSDGEREGLRNLFLPAYLATLALVLPRWAAFGRAMVANPLFVLLLLMAPLSTLWSIDPEASLRRAMALVMSGLFGVYLGARLETEDFLRLLAWALGIVMLASLAMALFVPQLGLMESSHAGAWRGAFTHKNSLGQTALLACVVLANLFAVAPHRGRWRLWSGMILGFALLVMADSKTALVIGLAMLGVALMMRLIRRYPRFLAPGLIGLSLIVGGLGAMASSIVELLGRDITLSGRVQLWTSIWDMIQQRWWLGYGFQAFWVSPIGPIQDLWDRIQWQAPNAHDGFLDVWLGLGFLGLVLFLANLVAAAVWCGARYRLLPRLEANWLISYLALFLMLGFVEINFLGPNSLFWVLFAAAVASIGRLKATLHGVVPAADGSRRHDGAIAASR